MEKHPSWGGSTDCQRARWAQPFFTSSPWPSLKFLGAFETVGKIFDAKLTTLTTQIRRRFKKYQSTVKYLFPSLSFQLPFDLLWERPGVAHGDVNSTVWHQWMVLCRGEAPVLWLFGSICRAHFLCLDPPMLPQKATGKIWKNEWYLYNLVIFFCCCFLFFHSWKSTWVEKSQV